MKRCLDSLYRNPWIHLCLSIPSFFSSSTVIVNLLNASSVALLGLLTRVLKLTLFRTQRRLRLAQVNMKSNYWATIFNYTMRSLIDWRLKEQTRSWNSQTELLRRRHARTFCTKLRSCSSDWSIVLFLSILFIAFVALRTSEIIDWHQLILFSSFLAIRVVFLKF